MKWHKLGRIYAPDPSKWWSQYYGIIPTPEHIPEKEIIRVYFASTDKEKFGRIFYVDVADSDPTNLVYLHETPLLDLGELGSFDDSGVNPSCIVKVGDKKWLYYIGYQRSFRVPYLLLTGAAQFENGHLTRVQTVPILERNPKELTIRSAPTIVEDNGKFKMWYVSAHEWELMNTDIFKNKLLPNYIIRYAESTNGIDWEVSNTPAINYISDEEFGFGRPWVIKDSGLFKMWYSVRKRNTTYRIGYGRIKKWIGLGKKR